MKRILLSIALVLTIISCMTITVMADDSVIGIDPATGRWNIQARTFNVAGGAIIYDTANRSNVVVISDWTQEEIMQLKADLESTEE